MKEIDGEQVVFNAIMDGWSLSKVCDMLDESRGLIYMWLHKDEERWRAYQEARKVGAHAMVEEAQAIADGASNEDVALARERVKVRLWQAERANREDFGQQKDTNVNITVGDLHLEALRSMPAEQIEDAEVLEVLPMTDEERLI
jgi:hypothetical protein